jgi:hypothetical protein
MYFCRYFCLKYMHSRICIQRLLHIAVNLRAVAARSLRGRYSKFVARAAQAQAKNRKIYLYQARSTGQRQQQ